MAKKPKNSKAAGSLLPPGVKRSTRRISPALLKMLMEDRGVASGGRNIVPRWPRPS